MSLEFVFNTSLKELEAMVEYAKEHGLTEEGVVSVWKNVGSIATQKYVGPVHAKLEQLRQVTNWDLV